MKTTATAVLLSVIAMFFMFDPTHAISVGVKHNSNAIFSQTLNIFVTNLPNADSIGLSVSSDPSYGSFYVDVYEPIAGSVTLTEGVGYSTILDTQFWGNCWFPDSQRYVIIQQTPYNTQFADYSQSRPDPSKKVASLSYFLPLWPEQCWKDSISVFPPEFHRTKPGKPDRIDTTFNVDYCGDTSKFFCTYDEDTWIYSETPDSLRDTVWMPYRPQGMLRTDHFGDEIRFDSSEIIQIVAVVYDNGYEIDRSVIEVNIDWKNMSFWTTSLNNSSGYSDLAFFRQKPLEDFRIEAAYANGSSFKHEAVGIWSAYGIHSDSIKHYVSADFTGDGLEDMALILDKGWNGTKFRTEVHVLKNMGSGRFAYDGIWWQSSGNYQASLIKHAAAGKFNADNKSDIAIIYDGGFVNGKYLTVANVLLSNTNSFTHQVWWQSSGNYQASLTVHAVPGYFNPDNYTDIAIIYDGGFVNGKYLTVANVLLSNTNSFTHQVWWQSSTNYQTSLIVHVVPGLYSPDLLTDIAILYDGGFVGGKYVTVANVFLSNRTSFTHQVWWQSSGNYETHRIVSAPSGMFSPDSRSDVAIVYDAGLVSGKYMAVVNLLLSNGNSFTHKSSWLVLNDYNLADVREVLSVDLNEAMGLGKVSPSSNDDIVSQVEEILPKDPVLYQNYPNPFNSSTVFEYSLPENSFVSLRIFNILGQTVDVLVHASQSKGNYAIPWNASTLASGIYFYQLQTVMFQETKKMVLLK